MSDQTKKGPFILPVHRVSTGGAIGLSIGAALFLAILGGIIFLCYRRRKGHKKFNDRPVTLRRPTAVRNPTSHNHYLKKSPSPTGLKSPPGGNRSSPGSRTSPGTGLPPTFSGRSPHSLTPKSLSPNDECTRSTERRYSSVKYESEKDKPSTPSKEELELNERNLVKDDLSGKLGKLHFKIRYSSEKGALIVTVIRCTDLPSKDPNGGGCDPYVKFQVLPEKPHKAKTRVLRKTCNPDYDEDFTFYGMSFAQLKSMTLHFVVLSFDRYSRDDIIGEVIAPLSQLELANAESSLTLARDICPRSLKTTPQGRGEILVSLCYQPAANRLTVVVLKARNLPKMDITGLSDPYVKIYLLYNGQRISKKKTHVKKRTLNPVFNESFVFDLPSGAKDLTNVSLDFLLLDWDRVTKNEVIGKLELGGPRALGTALHHWTEVVSSPRRQIAEWHKLRE